MADVADTGAQNNTEASTQGSATGSLLSQETPAQVKTESQAQASTGSEKQPDAAAAKAQSPEASLLSGLNKPEDKKPEDAEGKKPEDGAEKKEVKKEDAVPEKYEFKAPEGMKLDESLVGEFTPIAKELGLSNEKAQKLVDMYAGKVKKDAEAHHKAFNEQRNAWRQEFMKSPNYAEDLGFARKAVEKFADVEARELFLGSNSWLGDHPAVLKTWAKIGRAISEDRFIEGGADGRSSREQNVAQILYGGTAKK